MGRGRPKGLRYDTVIFSCPKKSGKTAIQTGVLYAWARTYGGEIYCLANTEGQAKERAYTRLYNMLRHLERTNPLRYHAEVEDCQALEITFKNPYAKVYVIPAIPGSQAGSFVSLSAWDELWAYNREVLKRLWAEFSPIPQLFGRSMRFVTTYAGYLGESELLWSIYEAIVKPDPQKGDEPQGNKVKGLEDLPCYVSDDGRTFVYWDHVPRMPWHTQEFLESRKTDKSIPAQEYLRLWQNRWVAGQDAFIDIEAYDALVVKGKAMGLFNRATFPADVHVA